MGVKRKKDGTYTVKTPGDAAEALAMAAEAQAELGPSLKRIDNLKEAARNYMLSNDIRQIPFKAGDKPMRGTVIQRVPIEWDGPTLKAALKRSKPKSWHAIWLKMTVRVPDKDKIQDAIKAGLIKSDAIANALVEHPQRPYIQFFADSGSDD